MRMIADGHMIRYGRPTHQRHFAPFEIGYLAGMKCKPKAHLGMGWAFGVQGQGIKSLLDHNGICNAIVVPAPGED